MSRNVVFVTIDSLRADHCGFHGYERNTTPTLDRLAEDGISFENAIAPGPTTPESLPAMFTGRYPDREGREGGGANDRQGRIRELIDTSVTIPERFDAMGYETAAFTPNPWTSRYFGFDQGFEYFEDFMDKDRSAGIWERMVSSGGSTAMVATRLLLSWLQRENTFKPWRSFVDEVEDWVDQTESPYFLWLFLLDVHFPYLPANERRTQSRWRTYEADLRLYAEPQDEPYSPRVHDQLVTAYDDALRDTDDCLEWLYEFTDETETSMVVTADHGEGFGDHGTYGHHDQLYEENVHVPLVVTGGPSDSVTEPISLRTLPRLLTDVANEDWPQVREKTRPFVGTQTADESRQAIRGTDWKFVRSDDEGELYVLTDGEERPLRDMEALGAEDHLVEQWHSGVRQGREIDIAADEVTREGGI